MLAGVLSTKEVFIILKKISFIMRGYSELVLAGTYSNALVPANLMSLFV